ncbi:MAG: 23S rRNA (guanosine(2251)-2'-O)-methyltransferase RlmB [Christensenellales bacterium]|jgi:23S rRNA (guanosine2251-2'-O)-methyltransferase
MAYNKNNPGFKGKKNAYSKKNKRGGNKKNIKKTPNEQRRYADTNHFDASDIYSMLPPSRPPKKRRNPGRGNMEGVVRPNAKYTSNLLYKRHGKEQKNEETNKGNFNKGEGKKQNKQNFKPKKKKNNKRQDNVQLNDGELIAGRNPVREALKAGRDLEKLMAQKGKLSGSAKQILALAREAGVRVQMVEKSHLDKLAKNHQGMVAFASAYKYAEVEDILNRAKERKEKPFIILLDQITDPHNLGAIMRSAVCTGAHGVIIPRRRAVGLTNSAVKAAAGAAEYMPVARVTNLTQTINELKKRGIWVYGMDMSGKPYYETDFKSGATIVIGSEGEGISKGVKDACDDVLSIPMTGEIGSFNASVAAGIIMHHVFTMR